MGKEKRKHIGQQNAQVKLKTDLPLLHSSMQCYTLISPQVLKQSRRVLDTDCEKDGEQERVENLESLELPAVRTGPGKRESIL